MARSRLDYLFDMDVPGADASGRTAIWFADPDQAYGPFDQDTLTCFQPFYDLNQRLKARGLTTAPTPQDLDDGCLSAAVVHAQRSRIATLGAVAQAAQATRAGGVIILDGDRVDGIDGTLKHLRAAFEGVENIAKAHGRAIWLTRPDVLPDIVQDWAGAARPHPVADGFQTMAGVFSEDGPDPASVALAGQFRAAIKGQVADLGAGWGYLSRHAAVAGAERVDLYESDWRALDLARAAMADRKAGFHWADVTTMPTEPVYDRVISNPPFHASRRADPSIGAAFISRAALMLKGSGAFWLVANRHLPYEDVLNANFRRVDEIWSDGRFKIIRAARPATRKART